MSFQLRFASSASADLTHMLRAVEPKLGWHSVEAKAPDYAASAASGATPDDITGGHPHPHISFFILVIVALVALIIGILIGRWSVTRKIRALKRPAS